MAQRSERPARIFRASPAWREATAVAAGPRIPAVSQVGAEPGAGRSGKRQRRQGVLPGKTVITEPAVADRTRVDPGFARFHRGVVEEVASLEVVGPVEHDVALGEEAPGELSVQVRVEGLHVEVGGTSRRWDVRGHGLGKTIARVRFREEGLPRKVGLLHEVAVHQEEAPHARPGQEGRGSAAQGADPNDRGGGGPQPLLALPGQPGEEDLPGVVGGHWTNRWPRTFAARPTKRVIPMRDEPP